MNTRHPATTLREARSVFFAENAIAPGAYAAPRWRPLRALPVRLPNFTWRQRAIAHHDLHHILTGYACTASGEMETAAWEFAAGRFRHAAATAFCLPLVGIGAILFPKRVFKAFVRGRHSRTLYSEALDARLLAQSVIALRARSLGGTGRPSLRDAGAYAAVVSLSLALVVAPLAAAGALLYACLSFLH